MNTCLRLCALDAQPGSRWWYQRTPTASTNSPDRSVLRALPRMILSGGWLATAWTLYIPPPPSLGVTGVSERQNAGHRWSKANVVGSERSSTPATHRQSA
jgi:hypothetical protein